MNKICFEKLEFTLGTFVLADVFILLAIVKTPPKKIGKYKLTLKKKKDWHRETALGLQLSYFCVLLFSRFLFSRLLFYAFALKLASSSL